MVEEPHLPEPESEPAAAPPARRRPGVKRVVLRLLAVVVAVVAGLLVTALTIDLGPSLRARAERAGSSYLQRSMHIGRLSAKLTPGVFVIDDLVIEGLAPTDRPFLRAKRITVVVPWWTAFRRRLVIESVDMRDWEMVVEVFQNGRNNFPRLKRESTPNQKPGSFTTTVKGVVAWNGQFTFQDHGIPWSTVARNLNVQVYRPFMATDYLGRASFSKSTVQIQSYEPFRTDAQMRFTISGGKVHVGHMDLLGDGSRSVVTGDVDLAHWPEQIYQVRSHIDFPTQKNIFFHREKFTVFGTGEFQGTFHLFKRPEGGTGRELKGTFSSPVAGVYDWRFPDLRGSVLWLSDRLEITNATSRLYGGTARFDFRMAPFGIKGIPTRVTWDVDYQRVDLSQLTDFLQTEGLRLSGRASGKNRLEWPLGKWPEKRGKGEVFAEAPPGVPMMTRELPAERVSMRADLPPEAGPFNPHASLGYLPIAGHIVYGLDPQWIVLDQSWAATERTYVDFDGRTAFGERSRIPFHVTSLDWQESDRVLAGIMTAFGSSTGAVPIEGYGQFDGVMLDSFTRPRIEGKFGGDRMRAWNTLWGAGRADVVIENSYVFVSGAVITSDDSEIHADGQFSLGYPRKDGGEELNARLTITNRPIADLRHAFELDDYPVDGLLSGDFHLFGKYETPFGFGKMTIRSGAAYRETFDTATASLRFEGTGIRLDGLDIAKSTGRVTGAAYVGWDGTYSFNADGQRIPVESLATASFPRAPLSGVLQFNASGAGTFDDPRYEVKLRVDDLFAGDEGIGQLNGRLMLRGELLSIELEAASPRLAVSGSGRIALTPEMDAELTVRVARTSLDPYVRFFEPRLSPFTTAVADGTIRVQGELSDIDHMVVEGRIEQLDMKLFDYRLQNNGPIELSLDRHVLKVDRLLLAGEGTKLQVDGQIGFDEKQVAIEAVGDANLGILQAVFRDIRSSGTAALKARINGPLEKPVFSGSATISDGRLRHFSIPHSLETINGEILFDASGIRVNDVTAKLGGGDVQFGGRIALDGFTLGRLSLTATGEQLNLRYPEGFHSIVDADLALEGTLSAPTLSGTVIVNDAVWSRRIETTPDLFNLGGGESSTAAAAAPAATFPLRFNIAVTAAQTLRIETNIAKMVASADLMLQGTYERPQLFGHVEIDRGDFLFQGNRYIITRGAIDFFNPARIEPVFDVEAETRVRLPGQTYRVTVGLAGTTRNFVPTLNSDPPLPTVDVVALLFGQTTDVQGLQNAELRALSPGAAQQSEEALLRRSFAQLLAAPISAPVTEVFSRIGLDTIIAPVLGTESDPLTPSARLVIGRRLSNRAYLTFTRALGTTQREQIIVLEYDQNDRLGWVITQTGDRTFAIDFRVRHRF